MTKTSETLLYNSRKRLAFAAAVMIAVLMVPAAMLTGSKLQAPPAIVGLGSPSSTPQPAVNLGSAGNFAILAESTITNTGATAIVGNVGLSPAAASYITGFTLIADSSNVFATSLYVTGKVYAATYASPTPSILTTAISDMGTAYTDAAGRSNPTGLNNGTAGEIGGLTFPAGLYKQTSAVTISSNITLSGSGTDVWIFQIAGTLTIATGKGVQLSGGADPKNIFWQVAGATTLNANSVFNGNILDATGIAMLTGAKLNGRALAQTAVTLQANTITVPAGSITAPTVSSTVPADAVTGVAVNSAISATFSTTMDPLTINATTYTLMQGTTAVSGTVSYSSLTAVFTPASNLAASTTYTVMITTGAKNLAGVPMASAYTWTFTTASSSSSTPGFPVEFTLLGLAIGALGILAIGLKKRHLSE
ncbi:MAG TPA: ice-binding family protein [Candidatus Lokiarchaeia archaeon]|nr:ice-binding family protein [Candidatus Lokiarchaeia archaeon]